MTYLFRPRVYFQQLMRAMLTLLCCVAGVVGIAAQERLVIIGGGARPPAAMSRFAEWAGGERARILIIPWATSDPPGSFASLKEDFAAFRPAAIELAPAAPLIGEARERFFKQLGEATGVFFTGGDQVRVTNVLKDAAVKDMLQRRYREGVVFGGTSAGTAIMSRRMITGEGDFTVIDARRVEVVDGLGLLPPHVIVDQHFIKRQRQNRLFGLIFQDSSALGLGIDEGTALLVSDNRLAEVVGASQVMMIDGRKQNGALLVRLLNARQKIDLEKRSLIR